MGVMIKMNANWTGIGLEMDVVGDEAWRR